MLVHMPFGDPSATPLALGLLQAIGRRAGFHVETLPLGLVYAMRYAGPARYSRVGAQNRISLGEWVFAEEAFSPFEPRGGRFRNYDELLQAKRIAPALIEDARELRAGAGQFLSDCLSLVDWRSYDLVGFTTTCVELNACLALARRLKELDPRLRIAMGGAKCEDEMGAELFRSVEWLDYVFCGEADSSFPGLLEDLAAGALNPIPGLLRRDGAPDAGDGRPLPVPLDDLPPPDFQDYFTWFERLGAGTAYEPSLKLEGSRGCWWGERSLCTFCGLNGAMVAFRGKNPDKLFDELMTLIARHRVFRVNFTDNIVDHDYLRTFFPRLIEAGLSLDMFMEVKSNLRRSQLELLRDAGVRSLQAGIEAVNTHILQLMRKGVTGIRNVQLLKHAAELGLDVAWNLLFNFPGETPQDYDDTWETLQSITHLQPPLGAGPICLDRFSPYHSEAVAACDEGAPGGSGPRVRLLGPEQHYRHVLPFSEESLQRLAYSFEYEVPGRDFDTQPLIDRIESFVFRWQRAARPGALVYQIGPDCLRIQDRRFNLQPRTVTLGADEARIYLACGDVTTPEKIVTDVRARHAGFSFDADDVRGFLDTLVARRWVLREGRTYLALAPRWSAVQDNYWRAAERASAQPPARADAPA